MIALTTLSAIAVGKTSTPLICGTELDPMAVCVLLVPSGVFLMELCDKYYDPL